MNRTVLSVVSVIGAAVSAAALVLLVPSLFRAGEQGHPWAVGVSACLTVLFAAGARHWRSSGSARDGG
ncbi:hypothetical protein [Kineococcus auxinigenes]|uniref:hypothetical protein n=1 Tax=unclassified Kineococcus TaxID=2621656 RepID=UPI003D7C46B4